MNHARILVAALVVTAVGCKRHDPAPEDIEEMLNFGFTHFDAEDDVELTDLALKLAPFVMDHLVEAEEGWSANSLSSDDLEAAGIAQEDVTDIIGASASPNYTNDIEPIVTAITWPDKTEVFDHVKEYEIIEDDDLDCFLAQDCLRYDAEIHQVASASLLGDATQDVTWQSRWILTEDGQTFYFLRTLCPDEIKFTSGLAKIFQQYSFAMVFVDDDGARRVEGFWADAEAIGIDLPENFAVTTTISQMQKSADSIDTFASGL